LLLYYITDRTQFPGNESVRRRLLLDKIAEAAHYGIDFIQLREKDLTTRDLETLTRDVLSKLRTENRELRTKLLINSRTDVAIATGADGVHLRSDDLPPAIVRSLWKDATRGTGARVTVATSCHSVTEVAAAQAADFVVFAPVFEKGSARPAGLNALHQACEFTIPVLALGGIILENARSCLDAGAAGIAAIRLFQENDLSRLIPELRALDPPRIG
jgi:thiamine-phosphate pyrophosphorylase